MGELSTLAIKDLEGKARMAAADQIILHPGPVNRGVELDSVVLDEHPGSVVLEQVAACEKHCNVSNEYKLLLEMIAAEGTSHCLHSCQSVCD